MSDYKSAYRALFNGITDVMRKLQELQTGAEEQLTQEAEPSMPFAGKK